MILVTYVCLVIGGVPNQRLLGYALKETLVEAGRKEMEDSERGREFMLVRISRLARGMRSKKEPALRK